VRLSRRAPAILGASAALVVAVAPGAAAPRAAPVLRIVGFASTLGDGTHNPRVQARNGGVITRCLQKNALAAVFVVGNVRPGASYQQHWSLRGKTIFLGKEDTLASGIRSATTVYMGFQKAAGLRNGRYTFQFVLDGRPHVLGSVTRRC
jgi:hypothetical protein